MARRSAHISIHGRVQGVGYRAWCSERARTLGLSGWVRNRTTGEVEALFSGPPDAVAQMLAACRDGPHGARVSEVRVLSDAAPVDGHFEVLATE